MLWLVQSENDLTDDKYVGRSAHHWIMLIAQRVILFDDAGCACNYLSCLNASIIIIDRLIIYLRLTVKGKHRKIK